MKLFEKSTIGSTMKNSIIYFILLNFFPLLIFSQDQDQGIQAIASLFSHIESELHKKNDDIVFSETDVENLWIKARYLNTSIQDIEKNYLVWKNSSDQEALQNCKDALHSLWLKTNTPVEPEIRSFESHLYALDNHVNNPLLTKKIKKAIAPYELPSTSAIAPIVNSIFRASRATYNSQTMLNAGFNIIHQQPRSYVVVASHPQVPGHLFKIYYDTEKRLKRDKPGWQWFVKRCQGAQSIKKVIVKKNIQYFKVPEKHIYLLPTCTIPEKNDLIDPKPVILIVEDMQLIESPLNYHIWKTAVTPQILDELYMIISHATGSSYRPDNIPYTKTGHFAFIDTEYPDQKPDFKSIRKYLSSDMRNYWDDLVRKGGS